MVVRDLGINVLQVVLQRRLAEAVVRIGIHEQSRLNDYVYRLPDGQRFLIKVL
jgi:hypothetical protein